jgi:hypothetical protein
LLDNAITLVETLIDAISVFDVSCLTLIAFKPNGKTANPNAPLHPYDLVVVNAPPGTLRSFAIIVNLIDFSSRVSKVLK